MKKNINFLSVFLLVLFLGNCDKSSTKSTVDPLVGTWESTEMSIVMGSTAMTIVSDDDNNQTMIFNEDGTFSYTSVSDGDINSGNGTWSTNGDKLTTIETDVTTVLDYSITGDVLTVNGDVFGSSETMDGLEASMEIKYKKQ